MESTCWYIDIIFLTASYSYFEAWQALKKSFEHHLPQMLMCEEEEEGEELGD